MKWIKNLLERFRVKRKTKPPKYKYVVKISFPRNKRQSHLKTFAFSLCHWNFLPALHSKIFFELDFPVFDSHRVPNQAKLEDLDIGNVFYVDDLQFHVDDEGKLDVVHIILKS